MIKVEKQLLSELSEQQSGICVGVKDTSSEFLKYLDREQIALGVTITVITKELFDLSLKIKVDEKEVTISNKIASNLFVKLI
jgi:DtxR family Mn-dependent transcriptional regulator